MAQKKTIIDEEADEFKKTRTGRALSWLNRKRSPGNGAGSRVIRDDDKPIVVKGKGSKKGDINLPDDKKGKFVGWGKWRSEPNHPNPKANAKTKDPIYGGDKDDPRWDTYRKDVEESKKKRYYGG